MQEAELFETLEPFVSDRIMFTEQGSYLSLAIAPDPMTAARRIRTAFVEERSSEPRLGQALPVLAA
ncbi:MAG TPA: hypothetical protein VJ810_05140 [Blastocatellia bacterium]|nr:hypothetical protein [Blastocatellia bacterium]